MDSQPDERDAEKLLTNPFYTVTFAEHLFNRHSNLSSKEDWVAANAHIMKDIGTKEWLAELLNVLSQPRIEYDGHDIVNPALAINLSDGLKGNHEPLITRELWIDANDKLVKELGLEIWLWRLLETLEAGHS